MSLLASIDSFLDKLFRPVGRLVYDLFFRQPKPKCDCDEDEIRPLPISAAQGDVHWLDWHETDHS